MHTKPGTPTRRAVARGLAWTAPAVALAATAPAYAASCDESCTSIRSKLSFGGSLNGNNWSNSGQTGSYKGDQAAAFAASWSPGGTGGNCSGATRDCGSNAGTATNVILFGGDPTGTISTSMIPYTSSTFCLHSGVTYTFSARTIDKACVGNAITVTMYLVNQTTGVKTSLGSYTSTGPASKQSCISGSFTPAANQPSTTYRLRFEWTFSAATWTGCDWNDLGVFSPSVKWTGYNGGCAASTDPCP